MGKNGGWISAVKKVLTLESKDTKEKRSEYSKHKCFKKNDTAETVVVVPPAAPKVSEKTENEQNMHAYYVAIATAAAAEAAAGAARAAAAEVARLTAVALRTGRSKEEASAIKIQSAFRAHLARRALRALRGMARLKSMIQGQSVQRQSMITLQCMQTLTRVQSQIRSRRVRISEENLALHQHLQQKCDKESEQMRAPDSTNNENLALQQPLQQKCEKEVNKLRAPMTTTNGGEKWNASAASKEQIEAKLQHKEEAARKRERALGYAYSHQTVRKNPSKPGDPKSEKPIYKDKLTDLFWGWSWLDRQMGTRPWENKPARDEPLLTDHDYTSQNTNTRTKTPSSTPPPRAPTVGPKPRPTGTKSGGLNKAQPVHQRRHTIAGSLVKDGDKSLCLKTVPSNGVVKGKAKSRVATRMGNGKTDKEPFGLAKKQLSYSLSSPGERRHSVPAKVDATS